MYLNLNIILILAYQYLTIHFVESAYQERYSDDDCVMPIPDEKDRDTPTPSTLASKFNSGYPSDIKFMHIRSHSFFKLTCPEGRRMSVCTKNIREIIVRCRTKHNLEYKGFPYNASELLCVDNFATYTNEPVAKVLQAQEQTQPGQPVGCAFEVPKKDYRMPIMFTFRNPSILYPDKQGFIQIRHNLLFKMSCAGSTFMTPLSSGITEITVKCVNGTLIEFRNRFHQVSTFSCRAVPKPSYVFTNRTCNRRMRILRIGFQTKTKFMNTYKVCFDYEKKSPIYTWHFVKAPLYDFHQTPLDRPKFIVTRFFNNIHVPSAYANQSHTLTEILNSKTQASWYVEPPKRYLMQGQLTSPLGFTFAYEQSATYFYENTIPMWNNFYDGVWKVLDKIFRRSLSKNTNRHIIATGTYLNLQLPDYAKVERPIYLVPPSEIPAPLFIWKMDYDLDKQTGIVFIALNNPFKDIQNAEYLFFCKVVECPAQTFRTVVNHILVFCCYKDEFEKAYGKLDRQVYSQIF